MLPNNPSNVSKPLRNVQVCGKMGFSGGVSTKAKNQTHSHISKPIERQPNPKIMEVHDELSVDTDSHSSTDKDNENDKDYGNESKIGKHRATDIRKLESSRCGKKRYQTLPTPRQSPIKPKCVKFGPGDTVWVPTSTPYYQSAIINSKFGKTSEFSISTDKGTFYILTKAQIEWWMKAK
jgi:hypothetical protein